MITNPCGVAHFRNKPCRECERLAAKDVPAAVIIRSRPAIVAGVRPSEETASREDGAIRPGASLAAQKQREYRLRKGDEYRARNRERMRRKRAEGDS